MMVLKKKGALFSFILSLIAFSAFSTMAESLQRTILKVENLTCGACLTKINKKLNTLDGFVGMGSNLSRGIVGVDHQPSLESEEIVEAVTSLGYPSTVSSESEIDVSKIFSAQQQSRSGGCCSVKNTKRPALDDDVETVVPSTLNRQPGGCGGGYGRSASACGCGASADSWKKLFRRFFDKD